MKHLLFLLSLLLVFGCSPRSYNDTRFPGDTSDGDTDTGDTSDFTDPDRLTIYDLRNPASPLRPPLGAEIELTRVVVSAIDTFQEVDDQTRRTGNFWVQERTGGEYSGILVYNGPTNAPSVVDVSELSVGDEVTVRGVYGSSFGRAQIAVAAVEVTGQRQATATAVSAADVATGGLLAAEYESVLVRVENVEVTESNAGFGRFRISDDLLVGNNLHRLTGFPPPRGLQFSSVTGVMDFSFDERSILPRSAADFSTGDLPDGDVYEIAALRDPANPERPARGSVVRVEGAVVTAVDRFREVEDDRVRTGSFFIQDINGGPWSGIYVFNTGGDTVDVDALQPGDVVTVDGVFDVFFDFDQIAVSSFRVTGSENLPAPPVVEPASIATGSADVRQWESVPVRVEDVVVTDGNAGFGQFKVTDDLRIGNNLHRVPTALRDVGQEFAYIVGLPVYTFNEHVLMPRSSDDVSTGTPPVADEVTIFDLTGSDPPTLGSTVELVDVVVTAVDRFLQPTVTSQNRRNQFWVADPAGGPGSGIYVFNQYRSNAMEHTVDVSSLAVGDIVTLRGTYTRFPAEDGNLQLQAQSLQVTGSGDPVEPTAISLADLGEQRADVLAPLVSTLVALPAFAVTHMGDYASRGDAEVTGGGLLNHEMLSLVMLDEAQTFEGVVGILQRIVVQGTPIYKLLPRSADDFDGDFTPAPDPTDPTDPGPTTRSVRDLKDPERAQDRPAFGASVVLDGVMIVAIDRFLQPSTTSQNRVNQFWVQDPEGGPWTGLRIFNRHSGGSWTIDVDGLDVGDLVRIEGTFTRFPGTSEVGLLQVEVTSLSVTGSGTPPAPAVLTTQELGGGAMDVVGPWEGQLVRVENVEVISDDGLSQFGELGLAGGGRLSNELSSLASVPVPSEWASVTGLLNLLVVSGNRLYSVAPTRSEDMVPAE